MRGIKFGEYRCDKVKTGFVLQSLVDTNLHTYTSVLNLSVIKSGIKQKKMYDKGAKGNNELCYA